MAHIVILGGGTGGLPMAYQMAELARAEDRVSVVSGRTRLRSTSLAPWESLAAGGRRAAEFPVAPGLEKKSISFVGAEALRLHPERNRLELRDGNVLDYDFLVLACGPRAAFEEIEGLGPDGFTQSVCHPDHLPGCARAWNRFVASPGDLVVGAVQGASCFAPAYESALHMEAALRRRGLRDRVTITFVTPEPYIGHLGVGGVADSRSLLESQLRAREIGWITRARVNRIERRRMHVTECDDAGAPRTEHVLPFKYAMMMPPFRGIDAVCGIEGLADERGFILIDEFQRNPKYTNIYAAGVTVASAKAHAASVPIEGHSTAYMIEAMVAAAAQNIRDQIDGKEPSQRATWSPACLADLGAPGLAFIAQQEPPPQKVDWFAEGDWVHMTKCSACNVAD
ncbi:MAG TPA: FAD/NAD(P)-binding oxidoreductase [Burkholderiales bacterium]|nr:FAD/NAD(P)-binding oxidoreductase [Burkholderiales bacterium]